MREVGRARLEAFAARKQSKARFAYQPHLEPAGTGVRIHFLPVINCTDASCVVSVVWNCAPDTGC